jgi:hypothetical protein
MREKMRSLKIHRRSGHSLQDIAYQTTPFFGDGSNITASFLGCE